MRQRDLLAGSEGQAKSPRRSLGVVRKRDSADDDAGVAYVAIFPSFDPPL
jgi:hypothetical protein